MHHLSNERWPRLEGVVSPFFSGVRLFFSSHRRSSTGEVSLSTRSHGACVFSHRKKKKVARLQNVPELMASQAQMKKKEAKEEKEQKKVVGWSANMVEREFEDTDEMAQWKNISQREGDNGGGSLGKNGACKGRGDPLEWRIAQLVKRYQPRKWGEDCWARIYSFFREYSL